MTVPMGMSITAASSRYDRPSNSRSTSSSRKRSGRWLIARSSKPDIVSLQQERFGIGCWPSAAVLLFIEHVRWWLESAAAPTPTAVANNSEDPGTAIPAGKCSKVSKGPQRRLLHDIIRIRPIPHEPARQPRGGVEMGKDDLVKTRTHRRCRRRL